MIRAGILTENDRVELIRGELLEKMPIGEFHVGAVIRLTRLLFRLLPEEATVSVQNPVVLADSEPEPDFAILTARADDYATGKPTPENVQLIIEVADTSLEFDRGEKLTLYAEAGIPEYWIVNGIDEQLEVFRDPQANGTYSQASIHQRGDLVQSLAFPGLQFAVNEIVG